MIRMISLIGLIAFGCGGSLSQEERQELRKGSESQRIQRVGEAELMEEAFRRGRQVIEQVDTADPGSASVQTVARQNNARVRWIVPGAGNSLGLEQELIDAYVMTAGEEAVIDNVQSVGTDSVLYTMPVVDTLPDSAVAFKGMWSVMFSKRDLVLNMD